MPKFTWSTTANDNDDADPTINWAEGQAPSTVNNSARAQMAASAEARDDLSGKTDTTGSADAYVFTSAQSFTALTDGISIAFRIHATNTGASTINVDSLGAKPLQAVNGTALEASALVSGSIYSATYDSGDDVWLLHRAPGGSIDTSSLTDESVTTAKIADGAVTTVKLADDAVTSAKMSGQFVCIQRVRTTTIADSTITTTTPAADTSTPQISEGDQVFSQAFTPLNAASTLRFNVHIEGDANGTLTIVMALFKGAAANAVAATAFNCEGPVANTNPGDISYEETAGATSGVTWTVRAGVNTGTFTIGGSTATLGGKRVSHLTIEEWLEV